MSKEVFITAGDRESSLQIMHMALMTARRYAALAGFEYSVDDAIGELIECAEFEMDENCITYKRL